MKLAWEHPIGLIGLGLLLVGQYLGLFWAPPEQHMGEVGRILYVHVPAAWTALLCLSLSFGAALGTLFHGKPFWDAMVEATIEVGVVLTGLLLVLGSLFARPTWGVWWDWDPRLTSSLVLFISFVGILLLRGLLEDLDRKALWSAVATVVAAINVPITYFSVELWRSIHQQGSSPGTMSDVYVLVLRINAFAFLLIMTWFLARRWRIARARALAAAPPPLPSKVKGVSS